MYSSIFLAAVISASTAARGNADISLALTASDYVNVGRGPCVGPGSSSLSASIDKFASFTIAGKRKGCAALCSSASFCTGFEWRPQSRKCSLFKGEIFGSDESKGWSKKRCFKRMNQVFGNTTSTTTTTTTVDVSGMRCDFEMGTDYYGFNIHHQLQPKLGTANSAEECCVECQHVSECSHFTFIWNTCWLKSSAKGRKAELSGVSGTCVRHASSSNTCRVQTLLPEASFAAPGGGYPRWEVYPPLPTNLSEVAASLVNGNTLVVVGDSDTQQERAATYAYSLADSEWTLLAPRPFKGSHHASVAIGDDVYLFGGLGYGSESVVQVYNIAANKWTIRSTSEKIPYGQMIGSASAVYLHNEIFVCGGLEMAAGLEGSVAECAAYTPPTFNRDPKPGVWRSIAPMLVSVNHHAAGTDGSRMYVFGGRSNNKNVPADGIRNVQIYDPATDSWSSGSMMPFGRSGMGAAPFLGGNFYIIGGEERHQTFSNDNGVFAQTEVYNTLTGDWAEGPSMLQGAHGVYPVANPSGSKVYVVGGGVTVGFSASSMFQTLSVPTNGGLTASNSVSETMACAVLRSDNAVATLSCNAGGIISDVVFAAKGRGAAGRCGAYNDAGGEQEGPETCLADVSNEIRHSCLGEPDCALAATDFSHYKCAGPIVVQVKCTVPSEVEGDDDDEIEFSGDGSNDYRASGTFPVCTASVTPVLDAQAGINAE